MNVYLKMNEAAPGPRTSEQTQHTIAVIGSPEAGKSTLVKAMLAASDAAASTGEPRNARRIRTRQTDSFSADGTREDATDTDARGFEYRGSFMSIVQSAQSPFSHEPQHALNGAGTAVILIDASKGLDPQSVSLYEACRQGRIPLVTLINKWDRHGKTSLGLLDEILQQTGMTPTPLNWPVGGAGHLRAMIDLTEADHVDDHQYGGAATDLGRVATARIYGHDWDIAADQLRALDAEHRTYVRSEFLAGIATPVMFGSALRGVGVSQLLDFIVDEATEVAAVAGA